MFFGKVCAFDDEVRVNVGKRHSDGGVENTLEPSFPRLQIRFLDYLCIQIYAFCVSSLKVWWLVLGVSWRIKVRGSPGHECHPKS